MQPRSQYTFCKGQADPRTTRRYDRSRQKLAKSAGYDVARALA